MLDQRGGPSWITINTLIDQGAGSNPDSIAFSFFEPKVELTRRALQEKSMGFAAGLQEAGVAKGDRVLTIMRNCPEQILTWLGCARLGAVFAPVNADLKPADLAHAIREVGPVAMVVAADRLNECQAALQIAECAPLLIVAANEVSSEENLPFWTLVKEDPATGIFPDITPADPVALLFTSGTTGLPKAVIRSHYSSICGAARYADVFEPGPDHRHICNGQLFHAGAQEVGFLGPLMHGFPSFWSSWFSASAFWQRVRDSGARSTELSGPLISFLLRQPPHDNDQNHNLRSAICASHGLDPAMREQFQKRFNVPHLLEIYAMTETGMMLFSNTVSDKRAGSVGKPRGWCEVKIADEFDRPVATGSSGQILLRSNLPHSMSAGYYGRPAATVDLMRNCWLHTGDIGRLDSDGWLYFEGRPHDRIRRRGENISAIEVEGILCAHPAVAECVVIGVPSDIGDEEVEAIVRLESDHHAEPDDLIAWCNERLASFKVPRFWRFCVDELPRTIVKRDVERHKVKAWPRGDVYDKQAHPKKSLETS